MTIAVSECGSNVAESKAESAAGCTARCEAAQLHSCTAGCTHLAARLAAQLASNLAAQITGSRRMLLKFVWLFSLCAWTLVNHALTGVCESGKKVAKLCKSTLLRDLVSSFFLRDDIRIFVEDSREVKRK